VNVNKMLLTFFGVGLIKIAPGTFGSLAAIPFGYLVLTYLHPSNLIFFAALVAVLSIKIIDDYEKEVGTHDSKEIVIDEVVGQWIAMTLVGTSMIGIVLSFIFFRIFDIWKPSFIGKIDREMSGGKGVMLDDVVAGIFGGLAAAMVLMLIEKLL